MWHGITLTSCHYSDIIMGTMTSQITSPTIVYSSVYSGADEFPAQRANNAENVFRWWSLLTHHIIWYGVLVYIYKFADCVSWSVMFTCGVFVCRYLLCPMVQVTNGLWAHKRNLLQIYFLQILFTDPIMSNFCTWHGSPAVVTCVQLLFDCMIIVRVNVTYIVVKFRL